MFRYRLKDSPRSGSVNNIGFSTDPNALYYDALARVPALEPLALPNGTLELNPQEELTLDPLQWKYFDLTVITVDQPTILVLKKVIDDGEVTWVPAEGSYTVLINSERTQLGIRNQSTTALTFMVHLVGAT